MSTLLNVIDENYEKFYNTSIVNLNAVIQQNDANKGTQFKESYFRLVSIQAWRTHIVEANNECNSIGFFKEAHNDALISHILARQGAWRVALSSLRSCIENVLFCLYYLDHKVEMRLWETGKHKLGFTEVVNYLSNHPNFNNFNESQTGIAQIKKEYALLSKAVHGSAENFRMTKTGVIEGLNIYSLPDLSAWATREKLTITSLNKILIVFFKELLQGAANSNLRKAVGIAVPEDYYADIKTNFGVRLRKIEAPAV